MASCGLEPRSMAKPSVGRKTKNRNGSMKTVDWTTGMDYWTGPTFDLKFNPTIVGVWVYVCIGRRVTDVLNLPRV